MNRYIKLSTCQSLSLYFKNFFSFLCRPPKTDKLWRLYEEGAERIDKEFDIAKIIKTTRNLNTFVKARMMDVRSKIELQHSSKNVIDLDCSASESVSEESDNPDVEESKIIVDI